MKYQSFLVVALLGIGLLSCQNNNQPEATSNESEQIQNKFTLTPFSASTDYDSASIDQMTYKEGQWQFEISNYELGLQTPDAESKMCANSGKGQHIHLIVGDLPYAAKYESSFDHEVEDGHHYILAFLSRSYHESIKNATAHKAVEVDIENGTINNAKEIDQPMIFYSRPKGVYVGEDTKKVMLDFYLVNQTLDDGSMVEADINGEVHTLTEWQPYYIEGLPIGKNKITLTLKNKEGQVVKAPHNPVTREFELKADPINDN